MATSDGEEAPHLDTGPVDLGNKRYLDIRLEELREEYSYERLSDLSAVRLGARDAAREGTSEEDFLHRDFERLYERFPSGDGFWEDERVESRRRWMRGDDYRGLEPLTTDQMQRIQRCHRQCSRNLDRARQDALEREEEPDLLSRFGSWLVDFADAATPIFYRP